MFLFFLLMMMIFSPLSSYVGVMCEDCQMMRKTASVPHGSTGRAVADSRLHDPAMMMMMMTMMLLLLSDGTCLGILSYWLHVPTSCNHSIRRHTHHTHTYSQRLPTYITYTLNQQNKTKEEKNSK